jgi:TorA maturation chaperone TorD
MSAVVQPIAFDPALAMARQSVYRFAALSLLDPQAGAWEQLRTACGDEVLFEAAGFLRGLPEALPAVLAPGERPLADLDPSAVLARLPASREQFNQEYEAAFGVLVSSACPPYETEYIPSKFAFQRSNALADVSGFYRAFGLTPSSAHPERPDHIVQELEFMAFLIGLERQADVAEASLREERLAVCRSAQTRFVGEHLAWWAPAFARLLARENPAGFHAAAGAFLAALIAAERAVLGIGPVNHLATPSVVERPETCEGCQL